MSEAKIIDRIKKLLSLANSTNEHEAANAAAQAAELMQKHEIKQAQLAEEDEEVEVVNRFVIDESKHLINWRATLMNGLAKSFGCHMFTWRTYSGGKPKMSYNVAGQPSKVDTISYMYQYLVAEVDRLADTAYRQEHLECRKSKVSPPSARAWKNAFRLGAANTIYRRLVNQREQTHKAAMEDGQSNALMIVKKNEAAVEVFIKEKFPELRPNARPVYTSRSGFQAGSEAGKSVGLGSASGRLGAGAKQLGA